MTFRNNKSIFVPESKKTDIYEAAGVSRRTNSKVEGVVGESTKGDPAGLAGWSVQRKRAGVTVSSFLSSFFLSLPFSLFFIILKTMSKEVIASESAGAAQNKSVETRQDPEPALLEVGTLQSKSAEDVDGSSSLREPTTSKPQQVSVCQNLSLESPHQNQPQR